VLRRAGPRPGLLLLREHFIDGHADDNPRLLLLVLLPHLLPHRLVPHRVLRVGPLHRRRAVAARRLAIARREKISEPVSDALVRPGEQDRHADHVHGARTTVAKWDDEGTYTRIGTLNERQRMAVLLAKFEQCSYEEIAAAMDLTVPAVKSLLFRARDQLREAIAPYMQGDQP
jgi:hypothetical protein